MRAHRVHEGNRLRWRRRHMWDDVGTVSLDDGLRYDGISSVRIVSVRSVEQVAVLRPAWRDAALMGLVLVAMLVTAVMALGAPPWDAAGWGSLRIMWPIMFVSGLVGLWIGHRVQARSKPLTQIQGIDEGGREVTLNVLVAAPERGALIHTLAGLPQEPQ